MGGFNSIKRTKQGGRPPGKIDASLGKALQKVEWGEYKLGDLFKILSSKKIYHANEIDLILKERRTGFYPYVVRATTNNGIRGYINENEAYLNDAHTLSFAQDTFTVFYQKERYFTGNKVKVLKPLFNSVTDRIMTYLVACFKKSLETLSWGTGSTVESIGETKIQLPIKCGQIYFEFMENFVAELESRRVAELESYLLATGLKDYVLTAEEEKALSDFNSLEWKEFNLEKLFGKATRGKRLKSDDRIIGALPFVTAGEAEEGISAFIGNDVKIFDKNTTTIDMFGSAKYRNYKYGADDHVAVVHTETLPIKSAIFVSSAIHKAAHTGEFNYGHNFYAKDADDLNVMLPAKGDVPDYEFMKSYISAIQKLVIKDVVLYADSKIAATKSITNK